ncbi:hypothetical protein BD309DRAFT_750869 [Dichomitus squalens]|nr:hypothetical protein BD309DRAFT_750869 [Dichomitus squalens]
MRVMPWYRIDSLSMLSSFAILSRAALVQPSIAVIVSISSRGGRMYLDLAARS